MKIPQEPTTGAGFLCRLALLCALAPGALLAEDIEEIITQRQPGRMHTAQGQVNFQPSGKPEVATKPPVSVGFGEGLHTLELSWAMVKLINQVDIRMIELTKLQILTNPLPSGPLALRLLQGQTFIASRGVKPEAVTVQTAAQTKVKTKGTEFLVAVDPENQRTEVTLFDGEAELSDGATNAIVRAGQQGIAVTGQGIRIRPILEATNLVQWWLYYPGVLDAGELDFTPAEQTQLRASLDAYRSGDLQEALKQFPGYPTPQEPSSQAGHLYLAGLELAVGAVAKAEAQLANVATNAPLAIALQTMMTAVRSGSERSTFNSQISANLKSQISNLKSPISASELLALSYLHQSLHRLEDALIAARAATEKSPQFAFAWGRVAELEFSFGRTHKATRALERALQLGPRNAQAHALRGFLLAADNKVPDALAAFDTAIRLDPGLGNAWLGRGLCRIRSSYQYSVFSTQLSTNRTTPRPLNTEHWLLNTSPTPSALDDLATAALLEPNRSLLHSYLAKAFTDAGGFKEALKELQLAKHLDTNDPTPWLYSALLNREQNRINTAVDDLEKSIDLNDNRAVYRSQFLLDEDRAVRSSSLANVYQTAGMNEVSLREAARAVSYDYANYSAHLFLSDSYNALRDPTRFNLRYETVWFNELLLANLLSPVGGTPLSQHISQQEYARLFDRNRLGLSTDSSYRSDGQYRELASQFGVIGKLGYSLDLDYQHNNGVRPNNGLDRTEWYSTLKYQITAQDSVFLLIKYQDYHSGDNFQYFDPTNSRPHFKFEEFQHPIILSGYDHEWNPGIHTLLFGGRLANDQRFSDRQVPLPRLYRDTQLTTAPVTAVDSVAFDVEHRSELAIYTAELQQIFDNKCQTFLLGARWQGGEFATRSRLTNPSLDPALFAQPPADTRARDGFERISGYGYFTVKLPTALRLTAGLTAEHLRYPENFRFPPIRSGQETRDRLNPKAALIWSPVPAATLRLAYTRSLGGVSLDESARLEPAQLAGFNQAFRSIIPESAAGSVAAPDHETYDAAVDLKLTSRTYLGLHGEILCSKVRETVGVFDYFFASNTLPNILPSATPQRFHYRERSAGISFNQLLADEWSAGAHYDYTRAELDTLYPALPEQFVPAQRQEAGLHRFGASLLFNHPSGFFAFAESQWYFQDSAALVNSAGTVAEVPRQIFQQLNLYAGYRFPRQKGDLTLGVQNLTDQNYRFVPLIAHEELPRERVLFARLRLRF